MDYLFSYLIYLSLLSCVILLSHLTANKYHNKELSFGYDNYTKIKFNHFLSLVFIAFIVGFRYKVGTDWDGYKSYFEAGNFEAGKIEFGYRMINQLIFNLKGSYTLVFFLISFLSWFFIYKAFPNQLLPLGMYFLFCDEWFFFSTNGVRQFVAFSFFLYAIKYLNNRNVKQYLLWIVIASLFHSSAWLLLPLFLIPWEKLYNRNIWLFVYFSSFIFTQNKKLLDVFPAIINSVVEYIPIFKYYFCFLY
jgi:transmembrane protein EpsG